MDAERIPKSGKKDEGDLVVRHQGMPYIFECKNEKKIDLSAYMKQAEAERDNWETARGYAGDRLKAFFAAIVKRRNYSIEDSYVVMPLREFARLIDANDPPF